LNALQGRLGDGVLANLVQYLSLNQASGCLQVVGEGRVSGSVFLTRGLVEHVEVGSAAGVAALAEMLGWCRGEFVFRVGVDPPRRTLDLPVDALLLKASYGNDTNGGNGHVRSLPTSQRRREQLLEPTPLVDPIVHPGLVWAAVSVAGPIGEIFVAEAYQAIGHSPRLLPENALGLLLQATMGHFKSTEAREQFLKRAEAVLAHHGYGRVEDDR
jgi:hypothetical protein